MNKKAFTIVEMAIVLVVIGIIFGMTVKGRALVRAARLKSEVNKLVKLEAAIFQYMTNNGGVDLTGDNQGNNPNLQARVSMQRMVDSGYFSKEDIVSPLSESEWTITQCLKGGTPPAAGMLYTNSGGVAISGNLCGFVRGGTAPVVVCSIETILDDSNIADGAGRRWSGVPVTADTVTIDLIKKGCIDYTLTPKHNYGYLIY